MVEKQKTKKTVKLTEVLDLVASAMLNDGMVFHKYDDTVHQIARWIMRHIDLGTVGDRTWLVESIENREWEASFTGNAHLHKVRVVVLVD